MKARDNMLARLSALLGVSLTVSGCVVGPDYEKPALPLPTSWSFAGKATKERSAPTLSAWWVRFKDPALDQLIAMAVQSNKDVARAKAAVREARATTAKEGGSLLPSASGSGSITRNRSQSTGAGIQDYTQYQTGFDTSWEIDLFGGNRRTIEAARYSEQSSEEDLRDTLVTVIGDVASNYIQAREYQELTSLAQRSAISQGRTAKLTRDQIEVGFVSRVDVRKAEAQAASTEADIPSHQISYAKAVNRLSVLTATPSSDIEAMLSKRGRIPPPPGRTSVGIPATVLASRPDVRAAERELAQSTAKIGKAEADRYPSFSLTGSIDSSSSSLSDLGKKSTIGWSWGPQISVPIFQGGQLKAAVDIAKAQRDQKLMDYQATVLTAMEEIDNAIIAYNRSGTRLSAIEKSTRGYRDAAKLSRELFKSGENDLFDSLDADRSLYSAEEKLIEAKSDIATYYISLMKALGGGWDGAANVSAPLVVDENDGPHLSRLN
ncbi:efflux transporter outer membrane subunit [Rhizobium halophytocola]|uniref:NodT family efflux transporter outer membrane factor (OMF) lipoprotein n=1 Tax=Rhizobium halophytocola TaxID=735519 RepID=A0ABS4E4M8_9HYPH|nr:efflux transporter outer membrane subunit [Rhizobium halophytocola]MBP1852872.1 NodT family efflux transporter outer membrane factor (OMF) lipoprotein [Rhizobium halophytocola]